VNRPGRTWPLLAVMLILALGALYAGTVLALTRHEGFWSGDAGVKLWQMKAWIANDWRTPWASYAEVNAALDPHHHLAPLGPPFAIWEGDRVLTIYTLPYIFLSSLLLASGGRLALYALPLVGGISGLALAAWMGRRFSDRVAWLTVLALGLATPWLFYSVTFWGHTVASALVWGALALQLFGANIPLPRSLTGIAAGLCLGAAVATRPEATTSALALAVVLIVWRSARRSPGWLALGLTLAALAGYAYQASVTGQAVSGQVAMNFDLLAFGTRLWSPERLSALSQMVVEIRHQGVLVALAGGAAAFVVARFYRRSCTTSRAPMGMVMECTGLVLVAAGAVVLLLRGHHPIDLFTGAPILCLLALSQRKWEAADSHRSLKRQLVVWSIGVAALSVLLGRQDGGWQWGPRYLTPVLGPLTLLGVEAWDRARRDAPSRLARDALWTAFVALLLAGAVTQAVGVVRLWQVRRGNDALSRALLRPPPAVIVTDIWFVPQIAPQVYGEAPIFLVYTEDEWRELDERMAAQGVERLRVVGLAGQETPLAGDVAGRWRILAETAAEVKTVPWMSVTDHVPREP
jgi:hypothetical protein